LLRLRFCSISPAKSDINPSAISRNVIYGQALSFAADFLELPSVSSLNT
jgi:hypothetical protein